MAKDITLYNEKNSIFLKKVSSKSELVDEDSLDGYLIDAKGNEKETRKIVDSQKGKKMILAVVGNNNVFNRRVLETMNVDYLVNPEKLEKRDTLKQRDSGMNHVTAKIAAKKGISLVFDMSELMCLDQRERAIRFSRIIQNLKICRKACCKIKVASFARCDNSLVSRQNRENFLLTLGADTQQTKNCCEF